MLDCVEGGDLPILQIHDELCFNIESGAKGEEQIKKIKHTMENTIEFKVPFIVEYGIGKSWGDAK